MPGPIPAPRDWGTFDVEPFDQYRVRWPKKYNNVPDVVIETWIHRHWREFQAWLPLRPLDWNSNHENSHPRKCCPWTT